MESPKKKSPRFPSISLADAIERTKRVYNHETRNAAPIDIVANHIGYKSSRSGPAATTVASLRYFGLLERPREGFLAVSKDFETFLYAPDETLKKEIKLKWLQTPQIFKEIIEKYPDTLPSEATLRFELIQKGFLPTAAQECIKAFLESVRFSNFMEKEDEKIEHPEENKKPNELESALPPQSEQRLDSSQNTPPPNLSFQSSGDDKIPIRLTGGRKAWIIIPTPFYEADKRRLLAQIEVILTEEISDI